VLNSFLIYIAVINKNSGAGLGGEFKNKERRRASLDNLITSPLGL
jgi:hypothetical protein